MLEKAIAIEAVGKALHYQKNFLGGYKSLCDTCIYGYDAACHNAKRPNVKKCEDYKAKY